MSVTPSRPSKLRACAAKGEPSARKRGKKIPSGLAGASSASTAVMSVWPSRIVTAAGTSPPRSRNASANASASADVYGSPSSTVTTRVRPSRLSAKSESASPW